MQHNLGVAIWALLKSLAEKYTYTLKAVEPIVLSTLKQFDNDLIDIHDLCRKIKHYYYINIPELVLIPILQSLEKQTFIQGYKTTGKRKYNQYIKNKVMFDNYEDLKLDDLIDRHQILLEDMVKFFDINNNKIDQSRAKKILDSEMLRLGYNIFNENYHNKDSIDANESEKYIFALFVHNLEKINNELYNFLFDIYLGNLYFRYISGSEKYDDKERKTLNGIKIILDIKILLYLLGISGGIEQDVYQKFRENIIRLGGKLCVFKHTMEELDDLFACTIDNIAHPDYTSDLDEMTTYYKNKGSCSLDIKLDKEIFLRQLNETMQILDAECDKDGDYEILFDIFKKTYKDKETQYNKDIFETKPVTINRDIWSIKTLSKLNSDVKSKSILENKVIFITANYSLVNIAKEYVNEKHYEHSSGCVTPVYLYSYIWTIDIKSFCEFESKQFSSSIIALLKPSKFLRQTFMKKCNEFLNDTSLSKMTMDDIEHVKNDEKFIQKICDYTKNDSDKLSKMSQGEFFKQYTEEKFQEGKQIGKQEDINARLKMKNQLMDKKVRKSFSYISCIFCVVGYLLAITYTVACLININSLISFFAFFTTVVFFIPITRIIKKIKYKYRKPFIKRLRKYYIDKITDSELTKFMDSLQKKSPPA